MHHSKTTIPIAVAFAALLGLFAIAGCATAKKVPLAGQEGSTRFLPGLNDGRISYITARLLEEYHYSKHPLDEEMSRKFFDGYLEALDPQHCYFLQSDIAELGHYRTNLDTLTIDNHGMANLKPACEIFQRYLQRLQQRVAYVDLLLKQDEFRFHTSDRILLDRSKAPYPKDLAEARRLWKQDVFYRYLQEKIGREISPTNSNVTIAPIHPSGNRGKTCTSLPLDSAGIHQFGQLRHPANISECPDTRL